MKSNSVLGCCNDAGACYAPTECINSFEYSVLCSSSCPSNDLTGTWWVTIATLLHRLTMTEQPGLRQSLLPTIYPQWIQCFCLRDVPWCSFTVDDVFQLFCKCLICECLGHCNHYSYYRGGRKRRWVCGTILFETNFAWSNCRLGYRRSSYYRRRLCRAFVYAPSPNI
jgi:hypothetical protein